MKSFEEVTEMYRNIFLNYHKQCKQEGWNLFDELKMIVDVMETLDEFGDDDLYTKVIDNILFESALLRDPNTFTIEKYKDYAVKNRLNNNQRRDNYIIRRRQRTIMDILNS